MLLSLTIIIIVSLIMADVIKIDNNPIKNTDSINWYWLTILSLNILIFVTALTLLILYYRKPVLFVQINEPHEE
jgi:hypothetical protein